MIGLIYHSRISMLLIFISSLILFKMFDSFDNFYRYPVRFLMEIYTHNTNIHTHFSKQLIILKELSP